MNSPSKRYRVELAQEKHDQGLAALLEESSFSGPVRVSYQRKPSVIDSFKQEAEDVRLYVLIEEATEDVVGMGAVSIRTIWLKGKITRLAYLSGLRITPKHQKAFLYIPQMYEAMYQATKHVVDVYITTIVSSNSEVIRMFEKKRKTMPEYRFVGEIETFFLGDKRSPELPSVNPQVHHDGAVVDTEWLKSLGATFFGTPDACAYVIKPTWKQYHVASYQGWFNLVRHLPLKRLGWPSFPKPGSDANYLAAGIYSDQNEEKLLQTIRSKALGYDFVMLSAFKDSSLARLCHKHSRVVYSTRLYEVIFHQNEQTDLSGLKLDVVFL